MISEITIHNPILPGFNPDPSICRVKDDFYIATSTFEWFPGVQIHHSKNLRDWKLISRPLDRVSQLNMWGIPSSGGIWAPDLSYHDGMFYLVYTNVRGWRGETGMDEMGAFKDTPNYLVTSESIQGHWSEPIYLNSSGFDPSLFHDDDGRKYLVNMVWDYRVNHNSFAGIMLQEYDHDKKKLVNKKINICGGTEIALTEGPHIYKRNGWYYLLVAEGGTSYGHAESLFRSKTIDGNYIPHPNNPILSSLKKTERNTLLTHVFQLSWRDTPHTSLPSHWYTYPQKAGHASICELEGDEWVLVHLMGRPLQGTAHCPLGRETGIQRVYWKDDWLYTHGELPENTITIPSDIFSNINNEIKEKDNSFRDNFDGRTIHNSFQFLRVPLGEEYLSLQTFQKCMRLYGAESPTSLFTQSLVAHRAQSFNFTAKTSIDIQPSSPQHFAGLLIRYDERNQVILRISVASNGERTLGLLVFDRGRFLMPIAADKKEIEIAIPDGKIDLQVDMRIEDHTREISFAWGQDRIMNKLPQTFDPAKYSDEYTWPMGFTGMFVGIGCFDVSGERNYADFYYYEYKEL